MKHRVFGIVLFILAVLVLLTPRYILPVCEFTGKQRMACSYMGFAEMFVGLIALSTAMGVFVSKTAEALGLLMLVSGVSGVSVIFMPRVLGYCKNPDMPCNYGTVPMLGLLGGLLILVSIAGIITS